MTNLEGLTIRLLSLASSSYRDNTDPRAAAHRDFVAGLTRAGIEVEVLTTAITASGHEVDPTDGLASLGVAFDVMPLDLAPGPPPDWPYPPSLLRLTSAGVPIQLLRGPSVLPHELDDAEIAAILWVLDRRLDRACPDLLLAHRADRLAAEALTLAKVRGLRTALRLGDRGPHDPRALAAADAVFAPSQALADELHESTGRPCSALPDFVDASSVRTESGISGGEYLAIFDPESFGGLPVFAQIADELGRLRPDITLLVVAGPEVRERLDQSGLDLKRYGNVALMNPPADSRIAWARVRVVLVPALDGSTPPRSAIEALINGLPVVASDRGGLPEVLGHSGVVLALPDRLTPATRLLPTPEEVAPWLDAITRLWDDPDHRAGHRLRAAVEAQRWDADALAKRYADAFCGIQPQSALSVIPARRAKCVVLVPHLNGIEPECEDGLQVLEQLGVLIRRRRGCSGIDVARNEMASDALLDGFESILFIDADVAFDPHDALRLLARPEAVVTGLYPKKGPREMASSFLDGVGEVHFGPDSPGLYPQAYAAAGFLRIHAFALRRMIDGLGLPHCNLDWGRGVWPFFMPLIAAGPSGQPHYLGEDWAFSHRLRQVGLTPLADATIRLWHHGTYPYGWEDAGEERPRYRSYRLKV